MSEFLEIDQVWKSFRTAQVLKNISFTVEEGSIVGLVGRNGSGKTMLMKCICGMIPVTSGEIRCQGRVIGKEIEMPPSTGALIEEPGFLDNYNGFLNLKFLGKLKGIKNDAYLKDVLSMVGLNPDNKIAVGKYSMGMKQRLGIAQAIIGNPKLLLLDEPTGGLDNKGVEEIRVLLKKINEEGTTIIIASHIAEDISLLANKVITLDQGTIVNAAG